jgi:hypothetical protein
MTMQLLWYAEKWWWFNKVETTFGRARIISAPLQQRSTTCAGVLSAGYRYAKFQNDWPIFGVSLMCDSWTGPTQMSVINFLIYCNGVTWFHKYIDAIGKSQDSDYLKTVTPKP